MDKAFRVAVILTAQDQMTREITNAADRASRALGQMQRGADRFGRDAMRAGLAAGAAIALPVRQAAAFEARMSDISTLIDTNVESMAEMSADVIALSERMPVATEDLTRALYNVRSAGIDAASGIDVLEQSSRLGIAGLGTTTESVNVMTSALNTFQNENLTAERAAEIFFRTVRAGKTTIGELASGFGGAAPIIESAGVQFADFQAATAAMTSIGTPTAQAQKQIRQAVVSLLKPTAAMEQIFSELGVNTGPQMIEKFGDIGTAFRVVNQMADSMGLEMAEVAGRVEGMNAMVVLGVSQNEKYAETLAGMAGGASRVDEAFNKQMQTFEKQFQVLRNQGNAIAITMGTAVMPELIKMGQELLPVIQRISEWIRANPELTASIMKSVAAFAAISLVAGGAAWMFARILGLVKALIWVFKIGAKAYGFMAAAVGKGIAVFAKTGSVIKALTVAARALNLAFLANPIFLVSAAVVAAAVLIYKYWEPISGFFKGLWDGIKSAFDEGWVQGILKVIETFHPIVWIAKGMNAVTEWLFDFSLFDAGSNLIKTLWEGMKSLASKPVQAIQNIVGKVRDYLPFSPAKVGPLKDIHRVSIIDTIAKGMKPAPMVQAMQAATSGVMQATQPSSGVSGPAQRFEPVSGGFGGAVINYAPEINISGSASESDRQSFAEQLRSHRDELSRMMERIVYNNHRKSFSE